MLQVQMERGLSRSRWLRVCQTLASRQECLSLHTSTLSESVSRSTTNILIKSQLWRNAIGSSRWLRNTNCSSGTSKFLLCLLYSSTKKRSVSMQFWSAESVVILTQPILLINRYARQLLLSDLTTQKSLVIL